MYTPLVVVVLLALFFDTAAASSPVMDPTMPAMSPPFGSLYPDPDGMLVNLCELCAMPIGACMHIVVSTFRSLRRVLPLTTAGRLPGSATIAVHPRIAVRRRVFHR